MRKKFTCVLNPGRYQTTGSIVINMDDISTVEANSGEIIVTMRSTGKTYTLRNVKLEDFIEHYQPDMEAV